MDEPLAPANPVEDRGLFVDPVGRNDADDRLADHLVGRIAEHRFGTLVPGGDDTAQILADNRIVRRLGDSREPKARLVQLRQTKEIAATIGHKTGSSIFGSHGSNGPSFGAERASSASSQARQAPGIAAMGATRCEIKVRGSARRVGRLPSAFADRKHGVPLLR